MFRPSPKPKTLILTALMSAAFCQQASAANIEGLVVDAKTHQPLVGVKVDSHNGNHETFSNDTGHFIIRDVQEGPVTLTFTYLGMPPVNKTINTQQQDEQATSLVITMGQDIERIVVTGQREAQNKALNLYRSSDAVTNYISSDNMGQFVDQNVAESLQRLPGTAISRDQGEGRYVSVRGVSPALSSVTVDGMPLGSPEDDSRAVPLDMIPTGSAEEISVTKAPTPDMPGDSIGGAINVKSASPFAHKSSIRYRVEGTYNDLSEETSPKGRLNFNKIVNKNFAIALGLNGQKRKMQSDNIEAEYGDVDTTDGDEAFSIKEVQQRKYDLERTRIGANLNMEYRTDNSRYYAKSLYSRFKDAETRQRTIISFEDGELASSTNDGEQFANVPADAIKRRVRFRTKDQDAFNFTLGAEHTFRHWSLDYQAGYSKTKERVDDEQEGYFEYEGDDVNALAHIGNGIPHLQITNTDGTANTAYLTNASYGLDRTVLKPKAIDDKEYTLALNATLPYAFGYSPLTLKAGTLLRWEDKDVDVNETELRDVPDVSLDQFTGSSPHYSFGNLGQGISSSKYLRYYRQHRDEFNARPKDEADNLTNNLIEDYSAEENVYAGYLMGNLDWDRWRVIAGVRVERTDFSADGNQLNTDTDDNITAEKTSVSHDYTNVLPGLHVAYDVTDDLIVRAAWTNTIARPSFSKLAPHAEINEDDQEIEKGNPELDPYEATNWDLMVDWYVSDASIISLGAFYKDIDNYVVDLTREDVDQYPGYRVTMPTNSTSAKIKGLEFNGEYNLGTDDDDSWLHGVLIGANATWLDTELELDERPHETFSLPESSERAANIYLGYERDRLSARLSWAYVGKSLDEVGDSKAYDVYVASHEQLDFTASYKFNDAIEVIVEMTNLTDEPLRLYQGSKGYVYQNEKYGPTYGLGIKGKF